MNSTLHRSLTRPPDIEDHQVLHIPRPDDLRELTLTDRLSLRIGLWLLQRAQRPRPIRRSLHTDPGPEFRLGEHHLTPAERSALLTYDLHRQLR